MFDVPTLNLEANAYYEFANFDSYLQKPPTIASLAHTEIEQYRKKPLVFIALPICHSQSVERHVKFVAEASAQVERFDQQQDEPFDKKLNLTNLRKRVTPKSSSNNVL